MSGGHLFVISGASGVGKSTILKQVMARRPDLQFSVSATSRAPREGEVNGVQYFFISEEAFRQMIAQGAFVEYDYHMNNYYGTLKSEIERIWAKEHVIVFDIDVQGGVNLKRIFGEQAFSIFIQAPSVDILRERLIGRGTDTAEAIEKRVSKAASEMEFAAGKFDYVLINDDLQTAKTEAENIINNFLNK